MCIISESSKSETDNSSIGEKFEFKQQDQLCTYTMLMLSWFSISFKLKTKSCQNLTDEKIIFGNV